MKFKIQLAQVSELGIHDQIHPAEWIAAATASPPPLPTKPSHLPSQQAKEPQQEIKADMPVLVGGSHAYLEENDWVPKCWREFWC